MTFSTRKIDLEHEGNQASANAQTFVDAVIVTNSTSTSSEPFVRNSVSIKLSDPSAKVVKE